MLEPALEGDGKGGARGLNQSAASLPPNGERAVENQRLPPVPFPGICRGRGRARGDGRYLYAASHVVGCARGRR
jgi:hypothetical protein